MRGRIISIKDFGLFVDVGTKRDGLVHVKDVSKDYFINQLHTKFAPGQDVDVWVKFCEPKSYKLGLQMFPMTESALVRSRLALKGSEAHRAALLPGGVPSTSATELSADSDTQGGNFEGLDCDLFPLEAYSVGNEVKGRVVRVSNFGVFLEFGAEVEGFLHKRKMSVSPKRRAMKPWEINPVGAEVRAWVVDIDVDRRRVNLSTYPPDKWPEMLPNAPDMVKSDDGETYIPALRNSRDHSDDDRILGDGEARDDPFSAEALEKQLAHELGENEDVRGSEGEEEFDFDDDDDDDDDDGATDFEKAGESLSAAEVRALMQASNRVAAAERVASAKLVIDDLGTSGASVGG